MVQIQNTGKGARCLSVKRPSGFKYLDLHVGITSIDDAQYDMFKDKIKACPNLHVVQEGADLPVQESDPNEPNEPNEPDVPEIPPVIENPASEVVVENQGESQPSSEVVSTPEATQPQSDNQDNQSDPAEPAKQPDEIKPEGDVKVDDKKPAENAHKGGKRGGKGNKDEGAKEDQKQEDKAPETEGAVPPSENE